MVFFIFFLLGVCQDQYIIYQAWGNSHYIFKYLVCPILSSLSFWDFIYIYVRLFFFCPIGHRLMSCHHFSLTCLIISTDLFQVNSFPCNYIWYIYLVNFKLRPLCFQFWNFILVFGWAMFSCLFLCLIIFMLEIWHL